MFFHDGLYTFQFANSHLETQPNDIKIVFVMVSDAYTITNTDPIPQKMALPILISVSGIDASLIQIKA